MISTVPGVYHYTYTDKAVFEMQFVKYVCDHHQKKKSAVFESNDGVGKVAALNITAEKKTKKQYGAKWQQHGVMLHSV